MAPTHMKIFIMDTECTGMSRDDKVCELAFIECSLVQYETFAELLPQREVETLINPLVRIHPNATAVHGLTDADVKDAPAISLVLPKELNVAPGEHFHVIGHSFPGFDMKFLEGFIPKQAEIGCSLRAAKRFLPGMPTYALQALLEALWGTAGLNVDFSKLGRAHSAMGDCRRVLALVNHILSFGTCVEDLLGTMTQRLTTISFGQYKGKKLTDLPEDYVEWLLSGDCQAASWELRRALKEL